MNFPFTVELQPSFSFWAGWLAAGIALTAAAVILWAAFHRYLRKYLLPDGAAARFRLSAAETAVIRQKALRELEVLEREYREGSLTARETSQKLSVLVREFAGSMTGMSLLGYTLSDIRHLRMPALTGLVEACYVPEFADYDEQNEQGPGDRGVTREYMLRALRRTEEAVKRWR